MKYKQNYRIPAIILTYLIGSQIYFDGFNMVTLKMSAAALIGLGVSFTIRNYLNKKAIK